MSENPLGKMVSYPSQYDPSVLVAIPRRDNRQALGIHDHLPFTGMDVWHAYELSWLDLSGKPRVGLLRLSVPCQSPNLVESKSLKLYLNSFNQEQRKSGELMATLRKDLEKVLGVRPDLQLSSVDDSDLPVRPVGLCLDDLPISASHYQPDSSLLSVLPEETVVEEQLYTHLFRSNCPVTGQPDWATITLRYRGQPLSHEGVLRYLISFREHSDYHEHCVERIYLDISRVCRPEALCLSANFTRRGGIDINPCRSSHPSWLPDHLPRLDRQ